MQTPFEQANGTQWTSRDDGNTFLDQIASTTSTQLVTLGESVQGRPLRAAIVGASPEVADNVGMIVATQHGNEPAGRDAAYAFIRDLAETTDPALLEYLESTCWVIIPTVNPDRILSTRENANYVNINGDYVALSQPESAAVMGAIQEYEPVVLIDSHEGGVTFTEDLTSAIPNSNAVIPQIVALSGQARDAVADAITGKGGTYDHYSGSTSGAVLRNAGAANHAVTVLLESYQNPTNDITAPARDFELRVSDQLDAYYAIMWHHHANRSAYRTASDLSRWPMGPPSKGSSAGSVPFFKMWQTPAVFFEDSPIIDAYINVNGKQVRVIDQLPNIFE